MHANDLRRVHKMKLEMMRHFIDVTKIDFAHNTEKIIP